MTGAPGLTAWVRTIPASASAFCSASAPASVTGAIAPGERERRDADDLVVGRELHDPLEHRRVEPERRARVDDREHRRLAVDRRLVHAAGDPDHLEDVEVALTTEAVAVDRLVHEGQRVVARPQVADAVVEVDRLDGVARQEVDGVERLGQAQQVLVVDAITDPPPVVEVGDVGRAADRPEGDPVPAELDVIGGIPRVERELRRRRPDQLGDHVRIEPHAERVGRRLGAGGAQDLARVRVEEVHPDLGQDPERAQMDRLELVGRHDLGRAEPDPRLRPGWLLRCGVSGMAFATATPTTSESLSRGRVHVRHVGLPRSACPRRSTAGASDPTLAGTPTVGRSDESRL